MQEEHLNKAEQESAQSADNKENQETIENNELLDVLNDSENIAKIDDQGENLADKLAEVEDKYIRLYSEFENYKRRTNKERIDLFKTANQDVLNALLPVLDDFERSLKAMETSSDIGSIKNGIDLVANKLTNVLNQKGLKLMDVSAGSEFNSDFHEAITKIPAPTEELKSKIVDVIEKGYLLNDKVIRFAKVVIGE